MAIHEKYMQRALDLATNGEGAVSPNPLVGCVVVANERIIAEGWHRKYGSPHAETEALNQLQDPDILTKSTVYVNLEPCSHYGQTPPCADLLISKQVPSLVIANRDPNPLVGGKGIEKLKSAGIKVTEGILLAEGRWLNRRFFTFHERKRPYIILKWAQTKDGFIARENSESKWISNQYSRTLVHCWRSVEDAVLVGTKTALADDPQLTARLWQGNDPVRVVIDKRLQLPSDLRLFDQSSLTLHYNLIKNEERTNHILVQVSDDRILDDLTKDLFERDIQTLIVEGGAKILASFIHNNLWDEARVFTSPQEFGKGIPAPGLQAVPRSEMKIVEDKLEFYVNPLA